MQYSPQSGGSTAHFQVHSAPSLNGPWTSNTLSVQDRHGGAQQMTMYPDTTNGVGAPNGTDGGKLMGFTEDAAGCRGVCEAAGSCTAFTWLGAGDERCFVREDWHWMPSPAKGAVSGRPWNFGGDNPSPVVDPDSGAVRLLYRSDSKGGDEKAGYVVTSLIGQAEAPSWQGPYTMLSDFDGPISSPQYPYEENEDPFMWRSSRGWHALFHSCTWTDSRSKHWPAEKWAGRYAFSVDGVSWQYSPEPAYNASIRFVNGTVSVFSRMERPFLLFDSDGSPTHLFNGVQRYDWDTYTFTLMHQVRRPQRMEMV